MTLPPDANNLWDDMNELEPRSPRVFQLYVSFVTLLTAGGWVLGLLGALKLAAWLLPVMFGLGVWLTARDRARWTEVWAEMREPLSYRPFLVLAALVAIAGAAYSPVMLDSLTYRLPRILLWLRENRIHYIGAAESRLDYPGITWELCNVPVVLFAGVRWTWIWNFVSWVVCYLLFAGWARQFGESPRPAARLALVASTTAFGVLQASNTSNDLFAVTLLLLSLHYIVVFERGQNPAAVNWAALALALGAAVKIHFTVLALPFLLWFFLSPSRPWRIYPWRQLPAWLPLVLLCSPLTTFVRNQVYFGAFAGPPKVADGFAGAGPLSNMLIGTGAMVWQAFQSRVNPLGLLLDGHVQSWLQSSGLAELAPRLEMRMVPVQMVDNASLGFFSCVFVVAGLYLGLRHQRNWLRSWPGCTCLAGIAGFLLAVSFFLPSTIGRSFAGFAFLMFPLAITGWMRMSARVQRCMVIVAVLFSAAGLILNPARPLWPAAAFRTWLEEHQYTRASGALDTYLAVAERGRAGRSLVAEVPPAEGKFIALIGGEDPLLPVLTAPQGLERAVLLPPKATVQMLQQTGVRHVLVSGMAEHTYAEIYRHLEHSGEYRLVKSDNYICKLARGPQEWRLYERRHEISSLF